MAALLLAPPVELLAADTVPEPLSPLPCPLALLANDTYVCLTFTHNHLPPVPSLFPGSPAGPADLRPGARSQKPRGPRGAG